MATFGKWRWLIYFVVAMTLLGTAVRAFSAPWTWSSDQIVTTIFVLVATVISAMWATVLFREGPRGMRDRWRLGHRTPAVPLSRNFFSWSTIIWLLIALGLVVFFNYTRR